MCVTYQLDVGSHDSRLTRPCAGYTGLIVFIACEAGLLPLGRLRGWGKGALMLQLVLQPVFVKIN